MRNGALLNLILMNKAGLISGTALATVTMRLWSSVYCMKEARQQTKLQLRANFSFFGDLSERIPWDWALQGKRVQDRWSVFKHFLQAQEWCIQMSKKLGKGGNRAA